MTDAELNEAAVALLAAEGMTQLEIGRSLNLSQSAVSRLLKGGDNPYLEKRSEYAFKRERLGSEQWDMVLRRTSRKKLPKYLDQLAARNGMTRAPVVRVFPVVINNAAALNADETMAARFIEFSRQAAPYVASLLMRDSVKTCGVTWGYMLHDLCVALRNSHRFSQSGQRVVQIAPLCGDPLQDRKEESPALTSSNIAAELGKIVNGDRYRAPWLGLVPAYIPEHFGSLDMKVLDRWIQWLPDYEAIFGIDNKPGMAGRLDMLLTSVGRAQNPLGFGNGRLIGSLGPKLEDLKKEIRGDVGGVLLAHKKGTSSPVIRMFERRWKGIRRHHLESCVKRANAAKDQVSGPPGTVILCLGAGRAEAVHAALTEGLVNHLIIDQELEAALENLFSEGVPSSEPRSN